MKKNHNWTVDAGKYWNFILEHKIIVWAFIILLLTVKWECSNQTGKFEYSFGCSPIRISDVKDIVK
jgi:hypothetical protein